MDQLAFEPDQIFLPRNLLELFIQINNSYCTCTANISTHVVSDACRHKQTHSLALEPLLVIILAGLLQNK